MSYLSKGPISDVIRSERHLPAMPEEGGQLLSLPFPKGGGQRRQEVPCSIL